MYFTDCILTDTQRQNLTEAGVVFKEELIGNETLHRHGISFDTDHLDIVVRVLGLLYNRAGNQEYVIDPVSGEYFRDRGYHDAFYRVPVIDRPTANNPVVFLETRFSGRYENRTSHLRPILEQAYGELQLGMVVETFRNQPAPFIERPGLLQVSVFSHPEGTRSEEIAGVDGMRLMLRVVGSTRDYFVVRNSAGRYIAMFKGDENGGTLWLLFNPSDCTNLTETLSYVMYALSRHLHPELGEIDDITTYRESAARREYLATARERLRAEVAARPAIAARANEAVARAEHALITSVRSADIARRLAGESVDEATLLSEIVLQVEREFADLAASPDFESISFENSSFVAITRPVEITHDGVVYSMGRYKLVIMAGQDTSIRIYSADGVQSPRGLCHPHVESSNLPCYGNQRENFARLLAGRQYSVLLPLIVMYLETGYQPFDSYGYIELFQVPTRRLQEA